MENQNQDVQSLAEQIATGVANENARGVALKNLQTSVSISLLNNLNDLSNKINDLNDIYAKALNQFRNQFEVSKDTLSLEDSYKLVTDIQNKQATLLDLYRKIAQGKDLFPSDLLSDDDKKILKLVKSFKSIDEKKKFMQLASDLLKSDVVEDFNE